MSSDELNSETHSVVYTWLSRIGLGDCIEAFKARNIDTPQALATLTYDDYDALGVTNVADRRRLFELVARVRQAAEQHRVSPEKNNRSLSIDEGPMENSTASEENDTATNDSQTVSQHEQTSYNSSSTIPSDVLDNVSRAFSSSVHDRKVVRAFAQDLYQAGVISSVLENPAKVPEFFRAWLEARDSAKKSTDKPVSARSSDASVSSRAPPVPRNDNNVSQKIQPTLGVEETRVRDAVAQSAVKANTQNSSMSRVNHMIEMAEQDDARIRVVVRKRPLSSGERKRGDIDNVQSVSRRTLLVHEPKMSVDLTASSDTHAFTFDDVFDHTCDTKQIYETAAAPLVGTMFKGANVACIAYGQTGSGKTFTMMGNPHEPERFPGVYLLAARDIFAAVRCPQYESMKLTVTVSLYEIYGAKLFDLLNDRNELKALEDHAGAVVIKNLRSLPVSSVEELVQVMYKGLESRAVGVTGANADSSRSHAVLRISLMQSLSAHRQALGHQPKQYSNFSFIDLAGSERGADTTNNDRKTRLEGAEINKSLLALKECIRSLYQESSHLPFRGSKLTQVLKDSFVGNSRTVMIATVSPNMGNCEHTLNTLRYAYRVKEIHTEDVSSTDTIQPPHGRAHMEPDHVAPSIKALQVARRAADTNKHRKRGQEARERAETRMGRKSIGPLSGIPTVPDKVASSEGISTKVGNVGNSASTNQTSRRSDKTKDEINTENRQGEQKTRKSKTKAGSKKTRGRRVNRAAGSSESGTVLPTSRSASRDDNESLDNLDHLSQQSQSPEQAGTEKIPLYEVSANITESDSGKSGYGQLVREDLSVIQSHRQQIQAMMETLREEMALVATPDHVQQLGMSRYVQEVERLLNKKAALIQNLRGTLAEYAEGQNATMVTNHE